MPPTRRVEVRVPRRHVCSHPSIATAKGQVGSILLRPSEPRALYVMAHGAGAGMTHAFMEAMAEELVACDIATLRFNFPYAEAGKRAPDPQKILLATIVAATDKGRALCPDVPLIVGGKSMGGRMTSEAVAQGAIDQPAGVVFLGFPLHAPGKASDVRGEHLARVVCPMLFFQGTRDPFADLALLRPLLGRIPAASTLHVVEGGDHGFAVPKRSGRTADEVRRGIAAAFSAWLSGQSL